MRTARKRKGAQAPAAARFTEDGAGVSYLGGSDELLGGFSVPCSALLCPGFDYDEGSRLQCEQGHFKVRHQAQQHMQLIRYRVQ